MVAIGGHFPTTIYLRLRVNTFSLQVARRRVPQKREWDPNAYIRATRRTTRPRMPWQRWSARTYRGLDVWHSYNELWRASAIVKVGETFLSKVRFSLTLISDVEITPDMSTYRLNDDKLLDVLKMKIARLATRDAFEGSPTLTRMLAKEGVGDGQGLPEKVQLGTSFRCQHAHLPFAHRCVLTQRPDKKRRSIS